jgi:hypothetical protein
MLLIYLIGTFQRVEFDVSSIVHIGGMIFIFLKNKKLLSSVLILMIQC